MRTTCIRETTTSRTNFSRSENEYYTASQYTTDVSEARWEQPTEERRRASKRRRTPARELERGNRKILLLPPRCCCSSVDGGKQNLPKKKTPRRATAPAAVRGRKRNKNRGASGAFGEFTCTAALSQSSIANRKIHRAIPTEGETER